MELRLVIKKVCLHCGNTTYCTQDKRVTDHFEPAMPVRSMSGPSIQMHIGGKFIECDICGYSSMSLHIDIVAH